MSLLMDALKRAEEAKRQQHQDAGGPGLQQPATAQDNYAGTTSELRLEPVSASRDTKLPDLDSHIERVDADLKATATDSERLQKPRGATPHASGAGVAASRSTAQTVFAAKGNDAETGSQAKRLMVICGIGALAALAVGTYFYWQLEVIASSGNRLAARPGAPLAARPPVTVAAIPTASTAAPAMPTPAAERAGSGNAAPPEKSAVPVERQKAPAEVARSVSRPGSVRETPRSAKQFQASMGGQRKGTPAQDRTTDQGAGVKEGGPEQAVRVSAQQQESSLMRAYDDLQAGRLDAARSGYQNALKSDRRNADALAGLGAIAASEGNVEAAERYYQLAVESDPRHSGANAGLASLRDGGSGTESRLKNLIAQHGSDGGAGPLHFALGNHYAAQRRWAEAQQSFFQAHASDADHPDYLANLAISLDQIGQPRLARQYYAKALSAAGKRPAAFDKAQVERRLSDIGQ